MISPEHFILMHLAIVLALLLGMAAIERRGRRAWTTWHRRVRTRRMTTEEVLRRLRKAARTRPAHHRDLDLL